MAQAERRRAVIFMAAVALAAVGVWALASRADTGGGGAGNAGGSRFTIATATLGNTPTGPTMEVFVADAQTMRLLVYTVDQSTRLLKLFAVRDMSEDVRMSQVNNDHPWPEELRSRLQAGDRTGSATKAEK